MDSTVNTPIHEIRIHQASQKYDAVRTPPGLVDEITPYVAAWLFRVCDRQASDEKDKEAEQRKDDCCIVSVKYKTV